MRDPKWINLETLREAGMRRVIEAMKGIRGQPSESPDEAELATMLSVSSHREAAGGMGEMDF